MHTIRKITKCYKVETLKKYFSTLMDLILNEIFNNLEDVLHYECVITYKDLIERIYNSYDKETIKEYNITNDTFFAYIEKIFKKCEDLSFSTENIKNTSDSKDLLLILCEIDESYKEKTLKLALRLISTYSESETIIFLKNADALTYFLIKKENKAKSLLDFIKLNEINIKSCLNNLLRKCSMINDELISVINIITSFMTKTTVFDNEEVKVIYNKIYEIWNNSDNNNENTNLAKAINEISTVYPNLNNVEELIKDMMVSFNHFNEYFNSDFNTRNELLQKDNLNFGLFYKRINFLNEHFVNFSNSFKILNFYFVIYKDMGITNKIPSHINYYNDTIQKINSSLILIFDKYYKDLVKVITKDKEVEIIVEKVMELVRELLNIEMKEDVKDNTITKDNKFYIYKVSISSCINYITIL